MVCAYNGVRPWVRYITTDPKLLSWQEASPHDASKGNIPSFTWSNGSAFVVQSAAGPLFNPIPNAPPEGPTHMINGNTGTAFWLGTYDAERELFNVTSDLQYISIDGGGGPFSAGSVHWAATSN